ncbi:hypothetical protein [Marinithermofilum abyssi]|uniref:hypothetical protein n=1 Tax=Marinithermofilum abyssi TaxID=1571185 RepID=UPI001669A609|nr:hypothetical protein [Marinithermofilum abyssi]
MITASKISGGKARILPRQSPSITWLRKRCDPPHFLLSQKRKAPDVSRMLSTFRLFCCFKTSYSSFYPFFMIFFRIFSGLFPVILEVLGMCIFNMAVGILHQSFSLEEVMETA